MEECYQQQYHMRWVVVGWVMVGWVAITTTGLCEVGIAHVCDAAEQGQASRLLCHAHKLQQRSRMYCFHSTSTVRTQCTPLRMTERDGGGKTSVHAAPSLHAIMSRRGSVSMLWLLASVGGRHAWDAIWVRLGGITLAPGLHSAVCMQQYSSARTLYGTQGQSMGRLERVCFDWLFIVSLIATQCLQGLPLSAGSANSMLLYGWLWFDEISTEK
jgi:hypothetical protein